MGLEDAYEALARVEVADRFDGGTDFSRVVSIVVDIDKLFFADAVVETAADAIESLQAIAQLMFVKAEGEDNGSCGHSVLDIEEGCGAEFKVEEYALRCTEVEEEVASVGTDIDSVEVGLDATNCVGRDSLVGKMEMRGRGGMVVVGVCWFGGMVVMVVEVEIRRAVGLEKGALLEEKMAVGANLVGKLNIGIHQLLVGAINVEVVSVGGGDDSIVGMKLQERAVVFIGFDHDIVARRAYYEVATKILANAAEESSAAET